MLTHQNTKTISDMREDAKGLLDQVQTKGPAYIFYRSKPEGVLMSLKEYNHLRGMAEDYVDALKAQEFAKEPKSKIRWSTHKEVLKELQMET